MNNTVDFSKSVYELSRTFPEIINIMRELGFESITTPGMLNTAGRFMTIPKGAAMKNISMDKIREALKSKGYVVIE